MNPTTRKLLTLTFLLIINFSSTRAEEPALSVDYKSHIGEQGWDVSLGYGLLARDSVFYRGNDDDITTWSIVDTTSTVSSPKTVRNDQIN